MSPLAGGVLSDRYLARPQTISVALSEVSGVDSLVITAVPQAANTLARFDIADAVTALTVKPVGYAGTVRVLHDRFSPGASFVLFGGLAKDRSYPGSTMVTTFNAGMSEDSGPARPRPLL